jgi:hypothetical protein
MKITASGVACYGGFGRHMLEKLGWTSGKGLGKNEDGVSEALRPKKKDDQAGVRAVASLQPPRAIAHLAPRLAALPFDPGARKRGRSLSRPRLAACPATATSTSQGADATARATDSRWHRAPSRLAATA